MPRNQGFTRKGKPGKHERKVGLGLTLKKAQGIQYKPRENGKSRNADGGMAMQPGVTSINGGVGLDVTAATTAMEGTSTNAKSILELQDIDDFLQQADLANREFISEKEGVVLLDPTGYAYKGPPRVHFDDINQSSATAAAATANATSSKETFLFKELSVPRRPAWDETTTREELERNERQSFLEWRRAIAKQEEKLLLSSGNTTGTSITSSTISVTPFEKNLQVWRQLWRVLERSDCLLQLVDARNPLFYLSDDLKEYAAALPRQQAHHQHHAHNEEEKRHEDDSNNHQTAAVAKGKPMMVLINKSDHLSRKQRQAWYDYLTKVKGWDTVLFFSAVTEQAKLDKAAQQERRREQEELHLKKQLSVDEVNNDDEDDDDDDEEDEKKEETNSEKEQSQSNNEQNKSVVDDKGLESDLQQAETTKVEGEKQNEDERKDSNNNDELKDHHDDDEGLVSSDGYGIDVPLTREQLIDAMMAFAEKNNCHPPAAQPHYSSSHSTAGGGAENRIQFGMVGFPNVGKSSVINVLVGSSKNTHGQVRVAVASQPGKTKHFQTLLLPDRDDILLVDCPGLVFPSFVSNTADLIAAGVYPIAQMRDHWPVVNLICQRIPREIINAQYGIKLPVPSALELHTRGLHHEPSVALTAATSQQQLPPPTAEEFLTTLGLARSIMASASTGMPDYSRVARMVIKDYANGKLLYCHPPPNVVRKDGASREFYQETIETALSHAEKLRKKLQQQDNKAEPVIKTKPKELYEELGEEEESDDDDEDDTVAKAKEPKVVATKNDEEAAAAAALIDDDLLEMVGSDSDSDNEELDPKKAKSNSKKHFKANGSARKKWGKKGRKTRNNDPYGCHSTPDDTLVQSVGGGNKSSRTAVPKAVAGGGVTVQGKYAPAAYTRPSHYSVALK